MDFVLVLWLAFCLCAGGGYVWGRASLRREIAKLRDELAEEKSHSADLVSLYAAAVDTMNVLFNERGPSEAPTESETAHATSAGAGAGRSH